MAESWKGLEEGMPGWKVRLQRKGGPKGMPLSGLGANTAGGPRDGA